MISAFHNPYYDNGIKLINSKGEKMDEEAISYIEAWTVRLNSSEKDTVKFFMLIGMPLVILWTKYIGDRHT